MGQIVAFNAQPRAGKDTLADLLVKEYGYFRLGFGDGVYQEISEAFGASIELLQSDSWKTRPQGSLALMNCLDRVFVAVAMSQGIAFGEPLTSRQVLQLWGTSYRRAKDPDYWVDRLDQQLTEQYNVHCRRLFVIADARVYPGKDGLPSYNEVEYIVKRCAELGLGYAMAEILRPGTIHTGHTSDDGFPDCFITHTIHNNGEPADMLPQIAPFIAGTPLYNPE